MDPCFTLVLLTQNPTGEFLQIGVAHIGVRRHFFKTVKRNTVARSGFWIRPAASLRPLYAFADVLKGRAFFSWLMSWHLKQSLALAI